MKLDWSWLLTTASTLWMVAFSAVGMYVALIAFTRLAGLRSFSKISSFDFATTVAFGSVLASAILTEDPPLVQAVVALGIIYGMQYVVARLRIHSGVASHIVDNAPILVMEGSTILHENLSKAGVTEKDLRSKLRGANVLQWDQIRAVVVESTGDVSVLHGPSDGPALDPSLLSSVRGAEQLKDPR